MRLGHDAYYIAILKLLAARSTCARRAVGAIVVDGKYRVLSTGYNGVPVGFTHCTDRPCPGATDRPGNTDRCMAVHAEQNAILQCSRLDLAHTLYVTCTPCFVCAKMIANTPIKRIVCSEEYADERGLLVFSTAEIKIEIAE